MNSKNRRRKVCICQRCNKTKLHFGLHMCSACLRRTKRETKPSFYLGTCFSEMSRRVKTYDPLRPNYYGKEICTKEQFISRFINDNSFLKLYKNWQENDFKRKYAPSIDRIDNSKDYLIENLQFISHYENTTKDLKIKIKLVDKNDNELYFDSCSDAAIFLKIKRSTLTYYRKNDKDCRGYKIYEIL